MHTHTLYFVNDLQTLQSKSQLERMSLGVLLKNRIKHFQDLWLLLKKTVYDVFSTFSLISCFRFSEIFSTLSTCLHHCGMIWMEGLQLDFVVSLLSYFV